MPFTARIVLATDAVDGPYHLSFERCDDEKEACQAVTHINYR